MRCEIPHNCKHFEGQSYYIDVEKSIAGLLWLSQDVGTLKVSHEIIFGLIYIY